jgi:hypothetical protein
VPPLLNGRDLLPPPSKTALPCGPRSFELIAAPPFFLIFYPVRPGGVYENTGGGGRNPRSPPRWEVAVCTAPPAWPPARSRRIGITGVSSAHHEEVGGLCVASPDFASSSDSRSRAATSERQIGTHHHNPHNTITNTCTQIYMGPG